MTGVPAVPEGAAGIVTSMAKVVIHKGVETAVRRLSTEMKKVTDLGGSDDN